MNIRPVRHSLYSLIFDNIHLNLMVQDKHMVTLSDYHQRVEEAENQNNCNYGYVPFILREFNLLTL